MESSLFRYADYTSFKNVINKAKVVASQNEIDSDEEFQPYDNNGQKTYKLSRFAVFLCSLVADDRKPQVKKLKVLLSSFANDVITTNGIERQEERMKLTHGEKYMTDTAVRNGLPKDKIGLFKGAGYRGMYNMNLSELQNYKN